MATFLIEAKGLGQAEGHLEEMGHRSTQLAPIFDDLIGALITGEKKLWQRDGGGGKNHWPPNTKATLATKAARGQPLRPMRATGALEASLTQKGAKGMIHSGGGTTLKFGTSIWYAQFSHAAKNPRRKRVILSLSPQTRKTLRTIVLEHIVSGS